MRADRQVTADPAYRRARRAVRVLGALAVVPPLLLLSAGAVLAANGQGGALRKWPSFNHSATVSNSFVAVDATARVGYAFSAASANDPLTVQAWDLDRLTPRSAVFSTATVVTPTPTTPMTVDDANHTVIASVGQTTSTVVALGLRGGAVSLIGQLAHRFPNGYKIAALSADTKHNRLFLVASPPQAPFASPAVGGVEVDVWRLSDVAAGRVTSELAAPVNVPNTCEQLILKRFAAGVLVGPDGSTVYFACQGTSGEVGNVASAPTDATGVARFDVFHATAAGAFRLFSIGGSFGSGDSYAAPPGGHWVALIAAGGTQTSIKVFDTTTGHWVGNVAYDGSIYAVTIEAKSARMYVVTSGGVASAELNAVPVTQLSTLLDKDLTGNLSRLLTTDSRTHRVFVPGSDDALNGVNAYSFVYQDNRPVFDASTNADADADSLRAPEVPGRTDSARSALASAVGIDYRFVGGTNALCRNTVHVDPRGNCQPGTRDFQFAVIRNGVVDNDSAGITALTMRVDDVTTNTFTPPNGDLPSPAPSPPPSTVPEVPPLNWPAPVVCSDLGGGPDAKTADQVTTACDATKQFANASVTAVPGRILAALPADHLDNLPPQLPSLPKGQLPPPPVDVQTATAHVDSKRLPDGTTETMATSTAYGLKILDVATIGRVVATAVTRTHGQPGSAVATYQVTVHDVVINGNAVCQALCSLPQVTAQLNQALGGRAWVSYGDASRLAFHSPGGVTARVQADPYEHAEDILVNDEPNDSYVTPALSITLYNDSTIAERLITRVALVSLSHEYRITDATEPTFTPPSVPPPPSVPVVGPTTITIPGSGGGSDPSAPTAQGPDGNDGGGLFGVLLHGMKVVFRSPRQVVGIALVWALLALPAYLAARRRLLLELPRLRRLQEEV